MLIRLTPRTLFGRALVIIAAPILILQLILAIVFFDNHWNNVTRRLSLGIAGDISVLIRLIEQAEPADRERIIHTARSFMDINLTLMPNEVLPPSILRRQPVLNIPDRMLYRALGEKLFRPYAIDTASYGDQVQILVQMPKGVMKVLTNRKRIDSTTAVIFVLWMVGSSLILLAIAIFFLRNQLRPIRKLAELADALGKGQDVKSVKPLGAIEIRRATRAFMAMRNRLRRNIDQRTELLAGVSHDLRTPLTRMKLELAILDKEIDVANLKSDVQDMVNMIDGYLAFARNQDTEQATETQLNAILDDVVQNVRRQGYNIELDIADLDPLPLRRNSFKRCITNLVDNAIRYTANEKNNDSPRISISACQKAGLIEIAVDDNGPGIPPNQRENAFRPFHRL